VRRNVARLPVVIQRVRPAWTNAALVNSVGGPSNPRDAKRLMTSLSQPQVADELRRRLAFSHAPYSGVCVAAAIETADGAIHYGVNVENAAYPEGVCAEASAISAAVSVGQKHLRRVWVASSLPGFIWPCGGCRQKIWEFAEPGCEVVSVRADGAEEAHAIEALLPLGFRLERAPR
jgi:cytidine deaminase